MLHPDLVDQIPKNERKIKELTLIVDMLIARIEVLEEKLAYKADHPIYQSDKEML